MDEMKDHPEATDSIGEDAIDVVRKLVADGVPLNVTPRFPRDSSHGVVLGKGKDRRAWVSQALYDAVKA